MDVDKIIGEMVELLDFITDKRNSRGIAEGELSDIRPAREGKKH